MAGPEGFPADSVPERERYLRAFEHIQARNLAVICSTLRRTDSRETPEALLFLSGFPLPAQNGAVVYGRPGDLEGLVGRTRSFIRGRTPWSLCLEQAVWEAEKGRLGSWGFKLSRAEPLMMRSASTLPETPVPEGLALVEARRPEELASFYAAMARGSGISPGFLYRFFRPESLAASLREGSSRFHTGLLEGRPVATAISTVEGEDALITSVATLPRFRRRGLGTAVTWAALRSARERGAQRVFLLASKMGEPVYRRMGFEVVDLTHIVAAPEQPRLLLLRAIPWALVVLTWFALVGHRYRDWPTVNGTPDRRC
jgi:ribosomal protein S18 acetylase RimI-like enzyme